MSKPRTLNARVTAEPDAEPLRIRRPQTPAPTRRYRRRALVLAAFFAAARRLAGPLIRAAFFADADLLAALRRRAADRACFASACGDAALRPSRLRRLSIARERFADVFFLPPLLPLRASRVAARRVSSETVPFFGDFSFTPARRAFDNPMAIAC